MRFLALLFLLVLSPVLAFAGQTPAPTETSKIENTPHFDSLTEEQFEKQTDLHTTTPSDKYLAYSIRLPKGWQKASSEKLLTFGPYHPGLDRTRHKLGRIAKYYAPQTLEISSSIDILAEDLSSDISLHDLYEHLGLTGKDYTTLGAEEVNNQLVVLYRRKIKEQSYIVRAVAQINASRIILISYTVPEERWDGEKAMQEKVVSSFQLLNLKR